MDSRSLRGREASGMTSLKPNGSTGSRIRCRLAVWVAIGVLCAGRGLPAARAESLNWALTQAYSGNPDMNQTRAGLRARDEEVPKAAAGMRPKASISASAGPEYANVNIPAGRNTTTGQRNYFGDKFVGYPRGATLNMSQTLFDGERTTNAVRQAESSVFAARAGLRQTEQTILQNVVTAYMNVLRDTAIQKLRQNNVSVLAEQLRLTRDRFQVGEVTRTDVAQAEAALAQAQSDFSAAQAVLKIDVATYRQLVGSTPKRLEPAPSVERLLPKSLDRAIAIAIVDSPAVVNAEHQVDAAALAVKVAEGALSPTVSVNAQVGPQYDSFLGFPGSRQFAAQATASLNVPLYQGGSEYASIRQAKELLGQARLNADLQRDNARANVVTAFAQLQSAKASVVSNQAATRAAEIALTGVREEAKVGQRTTLDVLNAQLALLNARVNQLISQRDQVVSSYAALASIGRLSIQDLSLNVAQYDSETHFRQVRNKWIGVGVPAGE